MVDDRFNIETRHRGSMKKESGNGVAKNAGGWRCIEWFRELALSSGSITELQDRSSMINCMVTPLLFARPNTG